MFFALWNMLISKVCSKQKLSRGSVSALEPKLCEPRGEREQGRKTRAEIWQEGRGGEEQPLVSREKPSRKWKFRLCPHLLRWACWLTPLDLFFHHIDVRRRCFSFVILPLSVQHLQKAQEEEKLQFIVLMAACEKGQRSGCLGFTILLWSWTIK